MPTAEKTRRSRWDTNRGKSIIPEAFARSHYKQYLAILVALGYDRFLCAKYIAKWLGTSLICARRILDNLMSEPYCYVKICDYQLEHKPDFMMSMRQFELTDLGVKIVKRYGGFTPIPPTSPNNLEHQMMGDHGMCSFRIGAKESNGRFVLMPYQEMLAHDKTPYKTKETAQPCIIPLGNTIKTDKGKVIPHVMESDREAFVLRDTVKNLAYFIAGIESGRGTETHEPKTYSHDTTRAHSYTRGKFEDCLSILKHQIVERYFNAPNAYFIFLEPPVPGRIDNMLKLWRDMTAKDKDLRPYLLFKQWHSYNEVYEASGDMLTTPFRIVAEDGTYSTFSFI